MAQSLKKQIDEVQDLLTYLELMSSIVPNFDFGTMRSHANNTRLFLQNSSKYDLSIKIVEIKNALNQQSKKIAKEFPMRKPINQIAKEFDLLRNTEDILNTGVTYGFLTNLMDLSKFRWYEDTPFHSRIGVGPHKGNGGVEEEFLLRDAFILLHKAEWNYDLMIRYANQLKNGNAKDSYHKITTIKYEIASYSRLTIISFYSFIECFVNSIGFNYLYQHEKSLSDNEILILKGVKKQGIYVSLKNKIEALQTVIRKDKSIALKVADENQREEPFISLFNEFEGLRNASVHYSPIKQRIWMSPKEWIEKARVFCDVALSAGIEIWKSCYPDSDGPIYMGELNKAKQLELSEKRFKEIQDLI